MLEPPVLYSFRRCPYAIRARLALAVSQQIYEHREVVLRDKPPELLLASPKATVPVFVLADGSVIEESLDIMLWALKQHDPQRWLATEAAQIETSLALIAQCDGPFKRSLDGYKYPKSEAAAIEHRELAGQFARQLDQRLQQQAYLSGPALALADAAIAPFVRQFAAVDANWFEQQTWTALRAWLDRITQSALFTQVMEKHPPWKSPTPSVSAG